MSQDHSLIQDTSERLRAVIDESVIFAGKGNVGICIRLAAPDKRVVPLLPDDFHPFRKHTVCIVFHLCVFLAPAAVHL
ncbi:MAG: hypothetical protein ABFD75_07610 [Smithella sp.]